MEETNLLTTLHRTKTSIDTNYEYLGMWLSANDLTRSKHFVCWTTGKIPINVYTGGNAQCNNPQTWATFGECVAYKNTHSAILGIGIMLGIDEKGRQIIGIDIDHINKNDLLDTMNDILHTVKGYQEISQSGDGVHVITFGTVPKGIRRKGGLEIYDTGRYIALTGTRVYVETQATQIGDESKNIDKIYKKYFGSAISVGETADITKPIYLVMNETKPINKASSDLVEKIRKSTGGAKFDKLYGGEWENSYPSQSEADMALCSILAFWTQKDPAQMDKIFRSSGLMREKWDRKERDTTYGAITINSAIAKCGVVYNPEYDLSPANKEQVAKQVVIPTQYVNVGKITDENGQVLDFDLNDTGNARRFTMLYNTTIKFNIESNTFMVWNGVKWDTDTLKSAQTKLVFDGFVDNMKQDMLNEQDKETRKTKAKNVERLYSNAGKKAVLEECQHQSNMPVRFKDFDTDDFLFNTPNGILDIKNNQMLPTNRAYMQSQVSGTMCSNIPTPLWDKFLVDTFVDKETINFIQKAMGQTLIGNNKEQKFFMLYGNGANGKSVFLDVMQRVFGDYCKKMKMSVFTSEKIADNAERVFAPLQKTRMLIANEIKEGKALEVGLLKDITGGGNIQGRYLYGEMFEYEPKFTLWMAVNTKPYVNDESDGFWRRAVLIECPNKVSEDKLDVNLEDKLMKEAPGILYWVFMGAMKLLEEGLKLTPKMFDEVLDYQKEMSTIDQFLEDKVDNIDKATSKAIDVYNSYYKWAKRDCQLPMNSTKFGIKMAQKYTKIRKSDGIYYLDCCLKADDYL